MEVDVLPLAVAAVPHAGLLGLHGARHAAGVHVLGQSNVGNARCIFPNQVHVRVQEDGVHWLVPLGQGCKGRTKSLAKNVFNILIPKEFITQTIKKKTQ